MKKAFLSLLVVAALPAAAQEMKKFDIKADNWAVGEPPAAVFVLDGKVSIAEKDGGKALPAVTAGIRVKDGAALETRIKQTFGARNFLLRGLKNVRQEWRWLASSFNLDRLMSLMRIRAGPTMANLRDIPFPLHPLQPDVHFQRR